MSVHVHCPSNWILCLALLYGNYSRVLLLVLGAFTFNIFNIVLHFTDMETTLSLVSVAVLPKGRHSVVITVNEGSQATIE